MLQLLPQNISAPSNIQKKPFAPSSVFAPELCLFSFAFPTPPRQSEARANAPGARHCAAGGSALDAPGLGGAGGRGTEGATEGEGGEERGREGAEGVGVWKVCLSFFGRFFGVFFCFGSFGGGVGGMLVRIDWKGKNFGLLGRKGRIVECGKWKDYVLIICRNT